jgi:hypothetical protein
MADVRDFPDRTHRDNGREASSGEISVSRLDVGGEPPMSQMGHPRLSRNLTAQNGERRRSPFQFGRWLRSRFDW